MRYGLIMLFGPRISVKSVKELDDLSASDWSTLASNLKNVKQVFGKEVFDVYALICSADTKLRDKDLFDIQALRIWSSQNEPSLQKNGFVFLGYNFKLDDPFVVGDISGQIQCIEIHSFKTLKEAIERVVCYKFNQTRAEIKQEVKDKLDL